MLKEVGIVIDSNLHHSVGKVDDNLDEVPALDVLIIQSFEKGRKKSTNKLTEKNYEFLVIYPSLHAATYILLPIPPAALWAISKEYVNAKGKNVVPIKIKTLKHCLSRCKMICLSHISEEHGGKYSINI